MHDKTRLLSVGRLYGLKLQRLRSDLPLAGSPERCHMRVAAEDARGDVYVIEELVPESRMRKTRIADKLSLLVQRGLRGIAPYLANFVGDQVLFLAGSYWQIAPFVPGEPLPRPGWVWDAWRGQRLAEFLVALRRVAEDLGREETPFDILSYIQDLMTTIRRLHPDLLAALTPVTDLLQRDLAPEHARLPTAFCHGDYHPLNVIWGRECIEAVVDWEFCGPKPELYDVANLIGCVGIEEPTALTGRLIESFLSHLRQQSFLSPISWRLLLPYVIALRFAWLSEWLRKSDAEMITLELAYMHLLMDQQSDIEQSWAKMGQ